VKKLNKNCFTLLDKAMFLFNERLLNLIILDGSIAKTKAINRMSRN